MKELLRVSQVPTCAGCTRKKLLDVSLRASRVPSQRARQLGARHYYTEQRASPPPFSPVKTAILSSALKQVPEHGITLRALRAGAQDAGYLSISSNLFPHGAFAIVHYHLVTQRLALKSRFSRKSSLSPTSTQPAPPAASATTQTFPSPPRDPTASTSNITTTITQIIQSRLLANQALIPTPATSHLSSALALSSLPANLPVSLRELALLVDEVLYLAGSTTVDSAWYTDRAGLAAIYTAAELYMTQDTSPDFKRTTEFVATSVAEASKMRSAAGMLGTWVGTQVAGLVDGGRSKGLWI